jgi:hypothetical protein
MSKHHTKWITIVGVVLMLIALLAYLATIDEANPDEVPEVIKSGNKP